MIIDSELYRKYIRKIWIFFVEECSKRERSNCTTSMGIDKMFVGWAKVVDIHHILQERGMETIIKRCDSIGDCFGVSMI
jgi:hypothetical protein